MPLLVHVAGSATPLVDGLADLLADPGGDPFAPELVVVPAHGIERWLSQRLSHRLGAGRHGDGVTAGVRFTSPWSLVAGLTGHADDDPWRPDRVTWSLLAVVDELLAAGPGAAPWARPLLRHLGATETTDAASTDALRRDRRWSTAHRLAGLFTSYARQRPALLTDWESGGAGDGAGDELAEDLRWQPELWRLLLRRRQAEGVEAPSEQHRRALARVAQDPTGLDLPPRLSIFGHTRLTVPEVELLGGLGRHREVHLWLPVASPAAWQHLEGAVGAGVVRRVDDDTARLVSHPLLRALGRDVRELQRSLAPLGARVVTHDHRGPSAQHGQQHEEPRDLLGWLQHDLRHDTLPGPSTRAARVVGGSGRATPTVQVHACHGLARQVEVLREVLVGLFADDPTLEPRDVLVMCPDVEAVAPLFAAGFGLVEGRPDAGTGGAHPAHELRVRLADRGLGATNPLLALAGALLDLVEARATLADLLALLGADVVRRRFALDDDALRTVTEWLGQAGVRWAPDAASRAPFGLEVIEQNTWRAGVERLLLGVTMAEPEGPWGERVPVDDVGSADVDLVGRVAEAVERTAGAVARMDAADTLRDWVGALVDGVEALGQPERGAEWQLHQARTELLGLLEAAGGPGEPGAGGEPGPGPRLSLPEVRSLLADRLAPRPTRASFRTGALTVSTLVPMRAVPHRVVCLVGLDDGRFPRRPVPDGDDVLARRPCTGERDARGEDRQLVLDAVAAAGERLVVTYSGRDERTGAERPPAVPLGDLLDALDRTATTADGDDRPGSVAAAVTWHHPLQPFDPRHLDPAGLRPAGGGPGAGVPFSFDVAAAAGARAWVGPRHAPRRWTEVRLPPPQLDDVRLADLQDFFAHPVRAFARQRLDVALPERSDDVPESLPVALDGLSSWKIGDRLLRAVLAGTTPGDAAAAELVRGDLPPGLLGRGELERVVDRARRLHQATESLRTRPPRSVDVTCPLPDGRRLTGVVTDVRGSQLVRVGYSSLSPAQRFAAWLDLLALTAADPDHEWSSVTVGWHRSGPKSSRLAPVGPEAPGLLADLVAVYVEGLTQPLTIHPRLAWTWVEETRRQGPSRRTVRSEWAGSFDSPVPGLAEDPAHVLVHGRDADWRVVQGTAGPDERWHPEENGRVGQYAHRVWQPLVRREQETLA